MAITFEGYERRINQINKTLNEYGIKDIEEAKKICDDKGIDVYNIVKSTQPICFENACWAYTVGAAIAIKKGCKRAADAAAAIGEGLQAFCIPSTRTSALAGAQARPSALRNSRTLPPTPQSP